MKEGTGAEECCWGNCKENIMWSDVIIIMKTIVMIIARMMLIIMTLIKKKIF